MGMGNFEWYMCCWPVAKYSTYAVLQCVCSVPVADYLMPAATHTADYSHGEK